MVYLPTFTIKNQPNVGKYTIQYMDPMGNCTSYLRDLPNGSLGYNCFPSKIEGCNLISKIGFNRCNPFLRTYQRILRVIYNRDFLENMVCFEDFPYNSATHPDSLGLDNTQ